MAAAGEINAGCPSSPAAAPLIARSFRKVVWPFAYIGLPSQIRRVWTNRRGAHL